MFDPYMGIVMLWIYLGFLVVTVPVNVGNIRVLTNFSTGFRKLGRFFFFFSLLGFGSYSGQFLTFGLLFIMAI